MLEAPVAWTLPQRIAFRFAFVVGVLLIPPIVLVMLLPDLTWFAELLDRPWHPIVSWFGAAVLGIAVPQEEAVIWGDTVECFTLHLVIAIVAVIATAVWSIADRRRTAYPRLAAATVVVLRHYLALIMLDYAISKIAQFPPPTPTRLDESVGELPPMTLMWTFMGSSQPYVLFSGAAEALAGVLLLWRRTAVAGALVAAAVMTNVVALNLCYHVSVKLISMQFLCIAVVLVLPHARRLIAAVLGRAVVEVPSPPRLRGRARVWLVVKWLCVATVMYYSVIGVVGRIEARLPPKTEIHGTWIVEKFVLDGAERPPLTTDVERWRKISFGQRGSAIRLMSDARVRFSPQVDERTRTIKLTWLDAKTAGPTEGVPEEVWRYSKAERGERATLVIDGTRGGKRIHAELVREPESIYATRGFQWVFNDPFNR